MRLSLRFLIPLALLLALIGYTLSPLVDRITLAWFKKDLDIRSHLIAETLRDALIPLATGTGDGKIEPLFDRVTQDERLAALGLCDSHLSLIYRTPNFPNELECKTVVKAAGESGSFGEYSRRRVHVTAHAIEEHGSVAGYLIVVHDTSFITARSQETKRYLFYVFLLLGIVISALTVGIAQLSWRGWVAGFEAILRGKGLNKNDPSQAAPELQPLLKDFRSLVRDLESDRQLRDDHAITWTAKTLKELLRRDLAGDEVLIVSNREPYIHVRKGDKIEVQTPASGLVTALEPIMRACSGTWIAHGSGSADREVVDHFDHVAVPPDSPAYRIRRVWLSKEEEGGYYYGFANEGLWPLCHNAHARPIFRSSDWNHYVQANEKFARAVIEEAKTADPVILVQDYHFALLPQMVRKELPRATIIMFWHIPWPNPEAFGICPWREEILNGLLGSTVVGFHTRFHVHNFLDTVDRFLETRIDRENSTVSHKGDITLLRNYPISIQWPPRWLEGQASIEDCRRRVRERHSLPPEALLGVGVDRLDYTKGIPERFRAVERLLELHPNLVGRFFFIQISAPSRAKIPYYQDFHKEVTDLADTINRKFEAFRYKPIRLIPEHHEPDEVFEYFRASELCFVSSLHDGMNLVAKEFVSARDDEQGVLVLSKFTGAARELPEALIVNPYDIDQCAEALNAALNMPASEQRERMRSMRSLVKEFNVYRWAGRMLNDAARIRYRNRIMERVSDWDLTARREVEP